MRLAISFDARVRTLSQLPCLIALSRRKHLRCHFRITTNWGVQQCNFLPSEAKKFLIVISSSTFGRIARWSNHFTICTVYFSHSSFVPESNLLIFSKPSISLVICSCGIVSITLVQKLFICSWFLISICFGLLGAAITSSRLSAIPGLYSITSSRWSLELTCSSCNIPIRVIALDWMRHCDTMM